MMWWQVVFWLLLVPCLIILGITYGTGKKLYKLFYVLAIYTYVTLATYIIDVFQLGRNWILSILVFSAFLLLLIGYFMSKNSKYSKKSKSSKHFKNSKKSRFNEKKTISKKFLVYLIIVLLFMITLIILGNLNYGLSKTISVVDSINASLIQNIPSDSPKKIFPDFSHKIMTITYKNQGFLSAPITEKRFRACAYDVNGKGYELTVETDPSVYDYYEEVSPGESKDLFVNIGRLYVDEQEIKKVIVASFNHDYFYDCSELKNSANKATIFKEIPVIG